MDLETGRALRQVDLAELGTRIRDIRIARKMTQAQVAGKDMSVAYVSRIESGTRRPELAMLEIIASRLGVSPHHLVSGADQVQPEEVRLQVRFAELALETGDAAEAERVATEVLADPIAKRLNDVLADAIYIRGRAFEGMGRLADAAAEYERIRREFESSARWVSAMVALSACYRESGDLHRAIDIGEAALRRLQEQGLGGLDESWELTLVLAAAYFERGDDTYAIALAHDALEQAEAAGATDARASTYWAVSIMESSAGRQEHAVQLAERALALLGEGEDERNLARLRGQVGAMMLRTDPPHTQEARRHLLGVGLVDRARCDVNLAIASLLEGDRSEAEALAQAAITDVEGVAPLLASAAHIVLGRVGMAQDNSVLARGEYQAAAAALTSAGADREVAQTWFELAELLDHVGDTEGSRNAYRNAAAATGLRLGQAQPRLQPAP
jgi:transcriptional regulator with XRE-family HTH domain